MIYKDCDLHNALFNVGYGLRFKCIYHGEDGDCTYVQYYAPINPLHEMAREIERNGNDSDYRWNSSGSCCRREYLGEYNVTTIYGMERIV